MKASPPSPALLRLAEVEQRVCDIASVKLGIPRDRIRPADRLVEDLLCDSLDLVELLVEIEESFGVALPERHHDPVYKAVFTRQPFRLANLAELVYLQQGLPSRTRQPEPADRSPRGTAVPFTQLDGRWDGDQGKLFEPLPAAGEFAQFRRRSDGMRCVLVPGDTVEIGCDRPEALADERPLHCVELDAFLIDAEPVSTTAYCRFLNSIGECSPEQLADWFVLDPADDRNEHMLIERVGPEWRPLPGTERWPMILVSWYGANAYSLWANGLDWSAYRCDDASGLPTEAQWEYAARGTHYRSFPWGDGPPSADLLCHAQHRRSARYQAANLPLVEVNAPLGLSPFGLHHMTGNVWQWCRDWYDPDFYATPAARSRNPVNRQATQVRSERGGSWVGPSQLCRSSFRRGRPPAARGRCLGFRCVSPAPQ